MVKFSNCLLATILGSLSGIHIYWAIQGSGDSTAVLPTATVGGRPLFRPSRSGSMVVALALALATSVVLAEARGWEYERIQQALRAGKLAIGAAFLLRAIGDFRYMGIFKKVKATRFARWDTRLYVPLCLLLAALSIVDEA